MLFAVEQSYHHQTIIYKRIAVKSQIQSQVLLLLQVRCWSFQWGGRKRPFKFLTDPFRSGFT